MDISMIVMWVGFILAAYSVVGNDVIQTLGTFLTSNEKRVKWWVLWLFAASILTFTLVQGYLNADISYGRLSKFEEGLVDLEYKWYYLIPPIALLFLTRMGIPVSTTFMILTLFSLNKIPNDLGSMVSSVFDADQKLGGMIQKSLMGYAIAFGTAVLVYMLVARITEKRFIEKPLEDKYRPVWIFLQWFATGFLWYQWLTQDLANIYVFHRGGNDLSPAMFGITLLILLGLLAFIFYRRGGAVQNVVRNKINTLDIRSATIIDFIYGIVLYIFKYNALGLWEAKLPMSTTWVFIGLLAGRELAIRFRLDNKLTKSEVKDVVGDLAKVSLGLFVSVVLVFVIKLLG